MIRTWTCRKCGTQWPRTVSICRTVDVFGGQVCDGRKPKAKTPAHREIMAVPYERWVEQFGEVCGICGQSPKPGKKLHRDHAHSKPYGARGLLCWRCNNMLPFYVTVAWLLDAAKYLDRDPIQRL